MTGVLLLIGGAAILAVSALAWTGRWRSWHRQVLTGPLPAPITLYPGVGFALSAPGWRSSLRSKPAATAVYL
jgi:hypothetical protein